MSQPPSPDIPNMNFPMRLEESGWLGVGRARNIKTDASHPMYKLNRQEYAKCWYCRFFCHWQKFFCVILRMRPTSPKGVRGRGVRSARHSIIESHGLACKAPAISEKSRWKKNKNKSRAFWERKTVASREISKKAFIQTACLLGCPKRKRLKLG